MTGLAVRHRYVCVKLGTKHTLDFGRVSTLLEQLHSAGVAKASPDDALTDGDKERLLEYLRTSHGTATTERKKIVLTRKSTSEIKQLALPCDLKT